MGDKSNDYRVRWGQGARLELAEMEPFKINPRLVFMKSKHLLRRSPHKVAYDVVDFEDSEYSGYYWTLINNVILVYAIFDPERSVFVFASFFANTAWAHQIFWGIEPEDDE